MTEQKPHLLKPSKSKPFPSVFYFLDTETELTDIGHKTKLHSLKMGVCQRYDRKGDNQLMMKDEIIIQDKSEFIDWFTSQQKQKSHVYLIAHNITYDATILDLFREFPKVGYKLQSLYSKGQVTILRWKHGSIKVTMIDNGNIFSGKLERWGKIFNIPKIEIDFDTCSYDELVSYCKRDVEIMVRAWSEWIKFLHEHDCGGFRETVGGTAFNTFRHKYMQRDLYVHKEYDVLELERKAYHGGRVEVFNQGIQWTDNYYYVDVNSMYPYIMRNYKVPIGLQGYSKSLGIKRLINYLDRYSIVADVTINVDEPAFVSSYNGHVCYPLGKFRTSLTTHEIEYCLMNGWLEKLHAFAWYKSDYIFTEYVDDFYNLRTKYRSVNNTGFAEICKLFMNTLYGKFAQTGISQSIVGRSAYDEIWHMPVIDAQTGKRYYQTALGGNIIEDKKEGESFHSMPAIAAHITANARLYLYQLMKQSGLENVFYCDTDSLIVNQLGYYNLENHLDDSQLGKLKIELSSDWLVVNAPKDYAMQGRSKVKGIRDNAIKLNDSTFEQEQWTKLAGLIRDGFENGYTSKTIEKHQNRIIYSGVVTQSGRVLPFTLKG